MLSKTRGLTSIELLLNDVLYPHINSSKGHKIKEQQGNSMLIALFVACRKKRGGGHKSLENMLSCLVRHS